ncbi:hypothetical protein PGT21_018441 [Puccinia graminis f. sp. tritici]|uniref:Uncharacterized protein n=1 Tax=Puccinia graminis f. sp. tritici TaxID=56615 RepID=A0A5B0LVL0_PUCGR|nr:hypothetical protein PGT21_018441 [Puccinia graminis f. sp. tritici]
MKKLGVGLTAFLMSYVVGNATPSGAIQTTPSLGCSNLLHSVFDAPDPCKSLTFREYLEALKVNESSCSVESGCSLRIDENSKAGFWDKRFLKDVKNSAKSFSVWRKAILEFQLSEGPPSIKGKLVKRSFLSPIQVEKSKNVWRHREDATPKSILDRGIVSPAGSTYDPEEKQTDPSHEPPSMRTFWIGSGSHSNNFEDSSTMSDASSQSDFSDEEGPASTHFSPDHLMRTTHGKLVRSTDPNAASEGKSVFDWIPEPNGMQLLRGGKKTKVYQRKAPLVPSPIFDEMETKWDTQLRGPLLRLQHLVEIKLQPNRYTTVDLMKEEAIEIQSILNSLVQILEQPKLIKYFKIKDNVLAYHESYAEGCRLLQEVADVWINVRNNLDRLEVHVNLKRFGDTLEFLDAIRGDVLDMVSQRMALEMKNLLREVENYVDLDGPHLAHPPSPLNSDPQPLPVDPKYLLFNTHPGPEQVPSASQNQHLSSDINFTPPVMPQVMRSIEDIADSAKSFLNTLGNLKECRDAMKKDATNVERVEEQRHVLENELQNLRWKLSESGTAKIWSELLTREKFEAKKVELDTVIQDMFAANYLIRAFQTVYLGRKVSYSHNNKTYHDLAWVISEGLKAALKRASARQMDGLADILKSSTTTHIMSINDASLVNVNALITRFEDAPPDGMSWIKLQGKKLAEILKFHEVNLSHKRAVSNIKSQLKEVRDSLHSESSIPYGVLLDYQIKPWLSKLDVFDINLGTDSLASIHQSIHVPMKNQFEWEVEKLIEEIVLLKNTILGLTPGFLKPPKYTRTKLLTRRSVFPLQYVDNSNMALATHFRIIKEKLLRGSSKRFQTAQLLPLTAPDGMLQVSTDFGSAKDNEKFSKHRGVIDDLIGLVTSIELYKVAGVCPMSHQGASPELDLAKQLWIAYGSKKTAVLEMARNWRAFGLIFQDIIEVMMPSKSIEERQTQMYSDLFEAYQQAIHTKDCCCKITSSKNTVIDRQIIDFETL